MKNIKLALLFALILALVLVIIQNTAPVYAHFLLLTAEMPVFVLLFLMAAGGFVSGLLTALYFKGRTKSKA